MSAFERTLQQHLVSHRIVPMWILLKQETASGSGISWAVCKSAPRSRQRTMPAPYHSVFTGRMPFLPPNQQRQSTEGNIHLQVSKHQRYERFSAQGTLHLHSPLQSSGTLYRQISFQFSSLSNCCYVCQTFAILFFFSPTLAHYYYCYYYYHLLLLQPFTVTRTTLF